MPDTFDPALPAPLLGRPFTVPMAAALGVSRHRLDRSLQNGAVRRMLRGVYVAADVADLPGSRAAALRLVVGPDTVAVDRAAAWLHGIELFALRAGGGPVRLDVLGHGRSGRHFGAPRRFAPGDVVELPGGLWATTPTRTVLDLARLLAPARALTLLDRVLREGRCRHTELFLGLPAQSSLPGGDRLRELVARADGRATGPAESGLRQLWYDAGLPTPTPGLVLPGTGIRLSLGLPAHRFGALTDEPGAVRARAAGWTVVHLSATRVLDGDPELIGDRLRHELSDHLLRLHSGHDAG